jgi:cyanate permease
MALWVQRSVPADPPVAQARASGLASSLWQTLSKPGPWLVAVMFGVYAAQWLAVVGFLPSIYSQAGITGAALGGLTALAAAVNMLGNLASGRLLNAGRMPHHLLWIGYAGMTLGTSLAFLPLTQDWPWLRYAGVLLFSTLGGLIPATLFALAVRLAPSDRQVATTVGWAQQWSALGQFLGPPAVAWVAARAGGWQLTPLVTGACCAIGVVLAGLTARHLRAMPVRS